MKYYYWVERDHYREYYAKETEGMTKAMKEVYLYRKYLEQIPIFIEDGDLFAGWYGYPDALPEDVAKYNEEKPVKEEAAYNKRKEEKDVRLIMNENYSYSADGFDKGHNILDYGRMIGRGLNAYIEDVDRKLATVEAGSEQAQYLEAMKKSLEVSEIFSLRYAELAKKMAAEAETEEDKARLLRIEAACRKVPMQPAEDFFEAIQAIYMLWSLNSISDDSWISVSFGSFDQFMYPYYKASKEKGVPDKEAEDLLVELYKKLDQFGGEYGGIDCALSLGGVDDEGNDLTNDLSYIIVSAEKRSMLRAPLLALRMNPKTPQKMLDELICTKLFEIGQPTFYGEEAGLKAVLNRGIPMEEAKKYMINTCMQLEFAGELVESGWGCVTNMHLPLELTINGGKPICGELPVELKTEPKYEYASMEEIYEQYEKYFKELFAYVKQWNLDDVATICMDHPNPFLSALTADCIERAADRWDGGAKYHDVIVENFGFANAADALEVIERLVFNEKRYTFAQLIEAAAHNYDGYEEIYKAVMSCPKYGRNEDCVDSKARRILKMAVEACDSSRMGNIRFLPSLHTLDFEVERGARIYAFLDGRLAGEPFNKNAGPANHSRSAGPTALALSALKLDQAHLHGGQALDIHFALRNMDTPEKRKKIAAFLKTYFAGGGLQVQVNALSSATLKKAYENPEQYKDLIVRIGGHSRYYNDLPDNVKQEFIKRISIEEGSAM